MRATQSKAPDGRDQVIVYNLLWLSLTGILLGLIGGLATSFGADDVERAQTMVSRFFVALEILLPLQLFFLMGKRREYWMRLLGSRANEAVGQAIGLSAGTSLVASTFFMALVEALPYLFRTFEVSGLKTLLDATVFTTTSYLVVAGLAALASVLALGWMRWRSDA